MASFWAGDFEVRVYDPNRRAEDIRSIGAHPADFPTVCRQTIVILAVPISQIKHVLGEMAPYLKPETLVADVCSVKQYPVKWMDAILPPGIFILATHPMFGPDSAAGSLKGHKIFLHPVRLEPLHYQKIKDCLQSRGLILIESSPETHDREIAISLFLTHFIGRTLADFSANPLKIDTEGYRRLLHILGVVENDTWQLFLDMYHYNPYAKRILVDFMDAAHRVVGRLEK